MSAEHVSISLSVIFHTRLLQARGSHSLRRILPINKTMLSFQFLDDIRRRDELRRFKVTLDRFRLKKGYMYLNTSRRFRILSSQTYLRFAELKPNEYFTY